MNSLLPSPVYRRQPSAVLRAAALVGGLALCTLGSARAASYTGGAITINDGAAASPFPSTVAVAGLNPIPATGNNITLTITNFSRPGGRPDDIDMLLVGPTGASIIFWSDVGGNATTALNIVVTLSDGASSYLPDAGPLVSGTFKPTNESTAQDPFASPAPAGPYGDPGGATRGAGTATFATQFNNTNPNGTWSLYVVDDVQSGETGSIGSWTLTINAAPIPEPNTWAMLGVGVSLLGFAVTRSRRACRS